MILSAVGLFFVCRHVSGFRPTILAAGWTVGKGLLHKTVKQLSFTAVAASCSCSAVVISNALQVGVGIREDVRRLQKDYNIRVTSAVDLVDVIRTTQPTLLAQGASLAALSR